MTKLVTAPMACGAVMVPTSMFMGQVVTAYNPFSGQQVSTKQHRKTAPCFILHVSADTNHVLKLGHLPVGPFWFSE